MEGAGTVWRGRDARQGTIATVRVMSPAGPRTSAVYAAFRDAVREAARLDHPNIAKVLDMGDVAASEAAGSGGRLAAGCPYVVVARGPGGALGPSLGRVGWSAVRATLLGVLAALAHAHARGVLHLDLRPQRVRVVGDGAPTVGGFGFAHAVARAAGAPTSGSPVGTPAWMSPEQVEGRWRDMGPWTDLYALGCLGWALASGRPPFGEDVAGLRAMAAHLLLAPPPLELACEVPEGFEGWLRVALEKDRRARFPDAASASAALVALGAGEGGASAPHGGLEQGGWRARDEGWLADNGGPELPALRPTPLRGLEGEREALWRALAGAQGARRAGVVVLQGPAGCGKSRLAGWLCERVVELGVGGALQAKHSASPGAEEGIGPMLRRALGTGGLDEDATAARLASLYPAVGRLARADEFALAALLSGSPRAMSAADRTMLVVRYLGRMSAERPLVIWLDDVQWGPYALLLSRALAEQGSGLAVLAVLTATDDELVVRPAASRAIEALCSGSGAVRLAIGPSRQVAGAAWAGSAGQVAWVGRVDDALCGCAAAGRAALEVAAELGRWEEAESWATRAERAGRRHGWVGLAAWARLARARAAALRGDRAAAVNHLRESQLLSRTVGDPTLRAACERELGGALVGEGLYDEAARCFSRAASHFEALGDETGVGQCAQGMGLVALGAVDLEEAEVWVTRAAAAFERAGRRRELADCLSTLEEVVARREVSEPGVSTGEDPPSRAGAEPGPSVRGDAGGQNAAVRGDLQPHPAAPLRDGGGTG